MRALLRRLFKANPRFARRQYHRARRLSRHDLGRRFAYSAYREIYTILRYLFLVLPIIFLPFAAWDIYALSHETDPGWLIVFDAVFFPTVLIMLLLLHHRPHSSRGLSFRRLRILCTVGVSLLALAAVSANILLLDSVTDLSIFSGGMLAIAIIFRFPDRTKFYIYCVAGIILYSAFFIKGISLPALLQNSAFVLMLAVVLDRTAYMTLVNNYLKKRRILELNQMLVQEDLNKSDMLSIAIHDLKSPLAGIMSISRMVKDNPDRFGNGEKTEILDDIEASSRQVLDRIEKLVSLASSTIGAVELKVEALEINSFVYAVIESWNYQASLKNIRLRVRLQAGLPPVYADGDALARILDNLVSNAVKFAPPGGIVCIHAHAARGPGGAPSLMLLVRDTGPGFTGHDLPQVFSRLTRLSARPTGGETSSGMGLYITEKLVKLLDGRIKVQNPAGRGARFALTLPAGSRQTAKSET